MLTQIINRVSIVIHVIKEGLPLDKADVFIDEYDCRFVEQGCAPATTS